MGRRGGLVGGLNSEVGCNHFPGSVEGLDFKGALSGKVALPSRVQGKIVLLPLLLLLIHEASLLHLNLHRRQLWNKRGRGWSCGYDSCFLINDRQSGDTVQYRSPNLWEV